MKKKYETPNVEIVKFCYKDQVVAASTCRANWSYIAPTETGKCNERETLANKE